MLSMLLDQDVKRVTVVDPADQARVLAEWDDGVAPDPKVFPARLRID